MNQEEFKLPDFKAYSEATGIKAVWYWNKDRYSNKQNRTGSIEKNQQTYD